MTEREQFEAWFKRRVYPHTQQETEMMWQAWQAARAAVEWPGSYDAAGNPLGPHDNNDEVTVPHLMLSPTHFCKDCGAYWRQCDDFTFNLRSERACEACDNAPVGGQLIALIDRAAVLADRAAAPAEPVAWIPVTTRLPDYDDHRRVMCYCEGADFAGTSFISIPATDFYYNDPDCDDDIGTEESKAATHWVWEDDLRNAVYAPIRDEAWIAKAMKLADEVAALSCQVVFAGTQEATDRADAARAALEAHLKGK